MPCGGRSVVMPIVIMSVVIIVIIVPCRANGIAMGIAVVAMLRHIYNCLGHVHLHRARISLFLSSSGIIMPPYCKPLRLLREEAQRRQVNPLHTLGDMAFHFSQVLDVVMAS